MKGRDEVRVDSQIFSDFNKHLCWGQMAQANEWGILRVERSFAEIGNMRDLAHCLPRRETRRGTHSDASLDFMEETRQLLTTMRET